MDTNEQTPAPETPKADQTAEIQPHWWQCPNCGASHQRGYFGVVGNHRCLNCGYTGSDGTMAAEREELAANAMPTKPNPDAAWMNQPRFGGSLEKQPQPITPDTGTALTPEDMQIAKALMKRHLNAERFPLIMRYLITEQPLEGNDASVAEAADMVVALEYMLREARHLHYCLTLGRSMGLPIEG